MKEEILELSKPNEGKNWKLEFSVSRKLGQCKSIFFYPPTLPFLVFHHKVIEADFDITLNRKNSHCLHCANDILNGLENSRNGIIVKNPEILPILRQGLLKLDYLNF